LPETADELCAVAQSAGAGDDKVYLGEKASELAIKVLGPFPDCTGKGGFAVANS
jgi:hypothetical protein